MQHNPTVDPTTTRTALVVVAHPRPDSLTGHIAELVTRRLTADGYRIDLLDLHAENFDPRMTAADLPEWGNREKAYSPEVENHMRRILSADVIVAVFPVYWMQVPAILKGWIDRVWNYGFAYGRSKPRLAGKRMLWLGLAGVADDDALVEFMQDALSAQLNDGIAYYCGFTQSSVGLLPGAEEKRQRLDAAGNLLLDEALTGAVRDAHYAGLENRALSFVDDFLAADRIPA
ncbi:NAD(P)H oxidoreductase [Nocardia amikacinitolerans]|uniref:NAD(P)H oxidoreductase n=1 Tax=Nocardia amikacinitolerans TaxID=756689 RepID=UPI0020A53D4C|nr:NAD(P)H oxidoreductase [Nocardia amikacinitolerans]MCP2291689.1 putative NADPH-quinone reductase (modulator of drug activity B) [Nocardia amikacinitolerans]